MLLNVPKAAAEVFAAVEAPPDVDVVRILRRS
jgi:hypothetical protein